MSGRAYDMSSHQRVMGYEGVALRGSFLALGNLQSRDKTIIQPIDTVIWEPGASSGIVLRPDDVTAWVSPDGKVEVHVRRERDADVKDILDEYESAMRLIDAEFRKAFEDGDR